MRPKVLKRDRKLQLSYELPHRIHCAQIYPVTAPNGSTIIFYAHRSGLKVLWRGGKRRKQQPTFQPQASKPPDLTNGGIIVLDSDDEPASQQSTQDAIEQSEYEAQEEEQDPDCPYASIIQDVDINVGTAVLHIAVPSFHAQSHLFGPLETTACVTIASADGAIRTLQIPLAPPSDEEKQGYTTAIARSAIELSPSSKSMPTSLAMKLFVSDATSTSCFLITSVSRNLSVWSVPVEQAELPQGDYDPTREALHSPSTRVSFHPSPRSSQLLVADVSGVVRIYDPLRSPSARDRPDSSSGESVDETTLSAQSGKWVMTYHTAFTTSAPPTASPALARRKRILDACWVLSGKAILVLLEDSEWGIWDLTASQNVESFTFRGYLTSFALAHTAQPGEEKKGSSKLAPMTPNTRRTKTESFFTSAPKVPDSAARGGISLVSSSPRTGHLDESLLIWYNGEVYCITSMQSFWQRSSSGAGGFGSLYAPGLSRITDFNLMNENITSISQFSSRNSSAGIGQMNTQRALLIAAEHRLIISQTVRPPTSTLALFQPAQEQSSARDQAMLDAGELDLGGMDRMLDSMAAGNALGRTRRVGFAH